MLAETLTAIIGFLAGVADFSVGAGFDALAIPSLILAGTDPQTAITAGLFAQAASSTLFGFVKHRVIASRRGAVAVAASGASALAFSLLSLSLSPAVVEAVLGAVLLTVSAVLIVRVVRLNPPATDDPPAGIGRLAVVAVGAGAVKGVAGSGMSAVMMLGQLVIGVSMSQAVAVAVVSKSVPAVSALIPRALGGGIDIVRALLLTAGAMASIVVAEKIKARFSQEVLSTALFLYSVAAGAYLLLKAAGVT